MPHETPAHAEDGQDLALALEAAGGIDRITIDVVEGGFIWRLAKGGREIFASGPDEPDQVASMLQSCEVLLNTELGIAGERLCQPAFN
ncbi:MAG TPA: hypothetical protein VFV87_01235 [Pirellulaceae bacterium]|nr:hypothetical protein [Pirellulaceae bacterium]